MEKSTVLIIDSEAKMRRFLRAGFELSGYNVLEAENGADGLKTATFSKPDLILLELILPDLSGAEVLEHIRAWSNVSIIIISGVSGEDQKVRLFKAGADDYVVKPFGMAELLARSEAVLRRYYKSTAENPVVVVGPLSVNFATREVELNKRPMKLTRKEHRLLTILAKHAGIVVTHDQLLREVWPKNRGDVQYLRVLVHNLRQKMETDANNPRLLLSESGIGYRLLNRLEAAVG
jgi:two-component system, OmpR family, KDP operon response regulator KdpE